MIGVVGDFLFSIAFQDVAFELIYVPDEERKRLAIKVLCNFDLKILSSVLSSLRVVLIVVVQPNSCSFYQLCELLLL